MCAASIADPPRLDAYNGSNVHDGLAVSAEVAGLEILANSI